MSKPKAIQETIDLGNGRSISIETGVLAKQADGAVMVRMGDTMMLASVVSAKNAKEDVDFMPLSVDYKEKYAAAGKFPGGFLNPGWWTGHCVPCFLMITMQTPLSMLH